MACFSTVPAHRVSGQARTRWPGLVAASLLFPAALAPAFDAVAQQQLPTVPAGQGPLKTLPTDALGQITPAWPSKKTSPLQMTPGMVPGDKQVMPLLPAAPAQPIDCAAFKGSPADMAALRQTARDAAGRRAIPGTTFDPLVPKNCAGQEWAFYLRFLGILGEGAL